MNKSMVLLVVLWLAVLVSALAVVYSVFDSRAKLNQLESLRKQEYELQVSWGQFVLEKSTRSSYAEVEKIAKEVLFMEIPRAGRLMHIELETN